MRRVSCTLENARGKFPKTWCCKCYPTSHPRMVISASYASCKASPCPHSATGAAELQAVDGCCTFYAPEETRELDRSVQRRFQSWLDPCFDNPDLLKSVHDSWANLQGLHGAVLLVSIQTLLHANSPLRTRFLLANRHEMTTRECRKYRKFIPWK